MLLIEKYSLPVTIKACLVLRSVAVFRDGGKHDKNYQVSQIENGFILN